MCFEVNKDINDEPERKGNYRTPQALSLRTFKHVDILYAKGKKGNRTHNLPTMRKEASYHLEAGCFFSALWGAYLPLYVCVRGSRRHCEKKHTLKAARGKGSANIEIPLQGGGVA